MRSTNGSDANPRSTPNTNFIEFDSDLGIAEVRLDGMNFRSSSEVGRFFDTAEASFDNSGAARWNILTNVTRFDPETDPTVWLAYSRRMFVLSRAFSKTRCLLDEASNHTRMGIPINPNAPPPRQFSDRQEAIDYLLAQPSAEGGDGLDASTMTAIRQDMRSRMRLSVSDRILSLDLSHLEMATCTECDARVDVIEEMLRLTGQKWYFLIDLAGFELAPEVWPRYAQRGRDLNLRYSLGTVRVSPEAATAESIKERAASNAFDPNIVPDREAGLAQIARLRAQAG